jgi:galactose mutarotase-like enzyme
MAIPFLHRVELADRPAYTLGGDDGFRATIVPDLGMLCWSLQHDGVELLGQPNGLEAFARDRATTGIPLLHPWANRLAGDRLVGADRPTIDPASRLVSLDANGLPIHGLNLADAGWVVSTHADGDSAGISARLAFATSELLAAFPFPHEVTVSARVAGRTLSVTTGVAATSDRAVPVSFGWHPYLRLAGLPRAEWRVSLPVRRRARLDGLMIPTGHDVPVEAFDGTLGSRVFDDLFTELEPDPVFVLEGGGRRIEVAMGDGYPIAQVYAPTERDLVAFEPMTAPGNALVSGDGLRWVAPGERFTAAFAVTASRGKTQA